jgi:hypothetical protein
MGSVCFFTNPFVAQPVERRSTDEMARYAALFIRTLLSHCEFFLRTGIQTFGEQLGCPIDALGHDSLISIRV